MRFLIKAKMDTETGNKLAKAGKLGEVLCSIVAELKPEAAYFIAEGGKRTALIFMDMADTSDLPAVAEPLFQALNAEVEVVPAMVAEDLQKAGPAIEAAAQKYG